MKYKNFGSLAVIIAAFLWSLDGLLRRALYTLPADVIVFWEHLLGTLILLPLILYSWKKFRTLTKRQWMAIIIVAFLSGALGTIFYTAALAKINFIPFSVIVLLQQLQPIFAIGAATILLKEPLSRKYIALATIALIAAYFISFPDLQVNFDTGQGTLVAALLAVGAAAAWGISTALSKYSLKATPTLHITAIRFFFAAIFALGFIFTFGHADQLGEMTLVQWRYLLLITFSTGLLALWVYYFGLKRVRATKSTLLELTWPLSAALYGLVFLHEQLSPTQWFGSIVLLVIVIILARTDLYIFSSSVNR